MTITTQYSGTCFCGARVARGDRVKWDRATRSIFACKACTPQRLASGQIEIDGVVYAVVIRGRDGRATSASVGVCTMELVGNGAIHIAADGTVTGIGAGSPNVRADMCDYLDGARAAARALAIREGIRK
jgi:hypothetical protein